MIIDIQVVDHGECLASYSVPVPRSMTIDRVREIIRDFARNVNAAMTAEANVKPLAITEANTQPLTVIPDAVRDALLKQLGRLDRLAVVAASNGLVADDKQMQITHAMVELAEALRV